jgi:hypothetical protein
VSVQTTHSRCSGLAFTLLCGSETGSVARTTKLIAAPVTELMAAPIVEFSTGFPTVVACVLVLTLPGERFFELGLGALLIEVFCFSFDGEMPGLAKEEALDILATLFAGCTDFFLATGDALPARRIVADLVLAVGAVIVDEFLFFFAIPVLAGNNVVGVDDDAADTESLGRSFIFI